MRQYTAYAEDLLIFERSVRASKEVVTHNKGTAVNTGLVINCSKHWIGDKLQ